MSTKRLTTQQKQTLARVCQLFNADDYRLRVLGRWVANQAGGWAVKTDQSFGYWELRGRCDDDKKLSRHIMTEVLANLTDLQDVVGRVQTDELHADHIHIHVVRADGRVARVADIQAAAIESLHPDATLSIGTFPTGPVVVWRTNDGDIVGLVMACAKLQIDSQPGWVS